MASWIKSEVSGDKRIRTKGAAKTLIKCRLGVPLQKNKADMLTRGKKDTALVCFVGEELKNLHNMHYLGKGRTLYLARKVNPNVTMEDVKEVVEQCRECQFIDPAPSRHEKGELHVAENWKQLTSDIMHYRNEPYLSMIDSGPGRVVIWQRIRTETAKEIKRVVEEVFLERRPVEEVLIDNCRFPFLDR